METRAKISFFEVYQKKPTEHNKANLEGQIYELYCYNQLIKKGLINLCKAKVVGKENFGNFFYSKDGKINYSSDGMHLAEFDMLGMSKNTIHWIEVTKAKAKESVTVECHHIDRKYGLLKILFPNQKIDLKIIVPKKMSVYSDYQQIIVPEPNYNNFHTNYFIFDEKINNLPSIKIFQNIVKEFHFTDEIIKYSTDLFNKKDIDLKYLKELKIFEFLYDVNHIREKEFDYYDVLNEKYGKVKIIGNKIYRNGKLTKGIKIQDMIKRMEK